MLCILHFSCKRRKLIGQYKVKILSFWVKILVALYVTQILSPAMLPRKLGPCTGPSDHHARVMMVAVLLLHTVGSLGFMSGQVPTEVTELSQLKSARLVKTHVP